LMERLRTTLGEIAFKRGSTWTWSGFVPATDGGTPGEAVETAQAVVGLMANPSGAAANAAWLAVDVHEAIHGLCDGLPVQLAASVGIVRGLAAGQRDDAGHLIRHTLQGPGTRLAALLGEKAPPHQTWVAGGLYRLGRGRAPTVPGSRGVCTGWSGATSCGRMYPAWSSRCRSGRGCRATCTPTHC